MDRVIKFRAWSNEYKKFEIYSLDQIVNGKVNLWFLKESPVIHEYIGLKDKNGKEIYDSDFIRYKIKESIVTCEVAFIKYGWFPFFDKAYMIDEAEWFEVIGNIHENPELLTTQQ